MTAALPPESALAYVRELSADVRAVVVLGPHGAVLAGPEHLAGPARSWLETAPEVGELTDRTPAGVAFGARARDHAIVAVAGPGSLTGPTALDLRTAVGALAGTPSPAASAAVQGGDVDGRTPERLRAANALISAV